MFRIFFICFIGITSFCFSQTTPVPVVRNTKAPIEINGVIIKQDKRNIGYVKLLEQYNNGKPATVYQVFLPNGTMIATAFSFGKGNNQWMVTILKDPSITYDVNSKTGSDVKDIASVLIKNGYL